MEPAFSWTDAIAGRAPGLPLQHVILNLVTAAAFAAILLFFVLDLTFRLSLFSVGVDLVLVAIFGLLYFLSRFQGRYLLVVHLASWAGFVYQVTNFAANGGSSGSSWVGGIMVMGLLAILHRPFWAVAYSLGALGLQLGMVWWESRDPRWVAPYAGPTDALLDELFTFFFCGFVVFGLILMVMRFYGEANHRTKAALENSSQSEERLLLAMSASQEGYWEWDLAAGTAYYSSTWKGILGYRDEELESRVGLAEALTPPEEWHRLTAYFDDRALTGAAWGEIEFQMVHKAGHRVDILARTLLVRDAKGRLVRYVGTHSDVSEKSRIVRDLQEARAEADRANRAKSEFLASMSHELRTPMNAILGFGQILGRDRSLSPRQRDYTQEILGAGGRLLSLINEVLDVARLESGKQVLTLEPVDAAAVLDESLVPARSSAAVRGVVLQIQREGQTWLMADPARLRQAFKNLLSGAIQASLPGGTVSVTLGDSAGLVRITTQSSGSGGGVGAALARRLVELMGGSAGGDAEQDSHRVWIELPQAPGGAP